MESSHTRPQATVGLCYNSSVMAVEQGKEGLAPVGGEIRVEQTPVREAAVEAGREVVNELEELGELEGKRVQTEAAPSPTAVQAVQRVIAAPKDRMVQEIESVLSEGLEELYKQLSPEERTKFKAKGEETARTLRDLLSQTKINAVKVLRAISDWLKVLSDRANKFYLEQEAKIKTDKLILLAEAERREGENAVA